MTSHSQNDPESEEGLRRELFAARIELEHSKSEVQRLQNSTRIQLGNALVESLQQPLSLFALPAKIWRIRKQQKKRDRAISLLLALDSGTLNEPLRTLDPNRFIFDATAHIIAQKSIGFSGATQLPVTVSNEEGGEEQDLLTKRFEELNSILASKASFVDAACASTSPLTKPIPNRCLYILNAPSFMRNNGYNARTRMVLKTLRQTGMEMISVALDRHNVSADLSALEYEIHLVDASDLGEGVINGVIDFADQIVKAAHQTQPNVILAASNWFVGLAGAIAAKRLGLPFVYEVRGFWEITRLATQPQYQHSIGFAVQELLETKAASLAGHVFTLNQPMRQELIRRSINADKISIAGNGVEFPKPVSTQKKRRGSSVCVVGFIGSVTAYAGIGTLLKAVALIRKGGQHDVRVKVVGGGDALHAAKLLAARLGIEAQCKFTGPVSAKAARAAYVNMDIIIIPRIDTPVTRLAQPIKVVEALAHGKAVIASNLAPLAEDVIDGQTGLLFAPENAQDLSQKILEILNNKGLKTRLEENALSHTQSKTWSKTLQDMCTYLNTNIHKNK